MTILSALYFLVISYSTGKTVLWLAVNLGVPQDVIQQGYPSGAPLTISIECKC